MIFQVTHNGSFPNPPWGCQKNMGTSIQAPVNAVNDMIAGKEIFTSWGLADYISHGNVDNVFFVNAKVVGKSFIVNFCFELIF